MDWLDSMAAAVRTSRIIWAALLLGQVTFGAVVLAMPVTVAADPAMVRHLVYVAVASMAAVLPIAMFLRPRLLRYRGGQITPRSYNTAQVVYLAMCEGQVAMLLAFAMVTQQAVVFFSLGAIPLAMFLLGFPREAE